MEKTGLRLNLWVETIFNPPFSLAGLGVRVLSRRQISPLIFGDLIWQERKAYGRCRDCGKRWKRVSGVWVRAGCEPVTNAAAAVSTIALQTLRVFNSAHRPLLTYIQNGSFENGKDIDLVEAMENALPDFEERSVVKQGLELSERWGRFPQPRLLNLLYLSWPSVPMMMRHLAW